MLNVVNQLNERFIIMKNAVKSKAGAPQKPVLVPRGKFTVDQAFQLNVEKANPVCKLTVRKFVESSAVGYRIVKKNGVAKKIKVEKILDLLDEVAKKATAGRPNFLYTRSAGVVAKPVKAVKPVKVKAVKVKPVVVAPVVAAPIVVTVVPDVTPPVVTTAAVTPNTDPVSY